MSNYNQMQAHTSYEEGESLSSSQDVKMTVSAPRSAKEKAPTAFRTISEVADELDVPQHVLRFWETKFTQIKPLKRGGGRRYYRPEDVALLKRIHHLLYTEGYTIKGVQKLLKGQGKAQIVTAEAPAVSAPRVSLAAEALLAKVDDVIAEQPKTQKAPLTSKQRAILEAMLGDLRDLRNMIRGDEQA